MDTEQRLAALGTAIPELMLPKAGVELRTWAVIACDQFTQDRSYWDTVGQTVGDAPSTLRMILPEVFLEDPGRTERIREIHRTMETYLTSFLSPPRRGCMYIERSTPRHQGRRGLALAIDLEQYDWNPRARSLVRATEGTVPARLPPRMEIRRGAPLELPHILLLIDDEGDRLLPDLGERAKRAAPVYDTPLMMESGHITGWLLDQEPDWACLAEGLEALARRAGSRYGTGDPLPFLYAVGDGNHSLAAAKAVWEEYKAAPPDPARGADHPCRWALVEVENLYDPGIRFEPIHRVLFGVREDAVLSALAPLPGYTRRSVGDRGELSRLVGDEKAGLNRYGLIRGNSYTLIESDAPGLAVDQLQPLLDTLVQTGTPGIDYIHGEDELFRLAEAPSGAPPPVGILLPPVKKSGFFKTVARRGPLPRKSFSMGEAKEKRFYLECRRLVEKG
ncbi:MAG: DUF1015 domain-containing protein [Treponema sp.]|jgi:hypothetical protein|nr:DUF1015 domain-containing protein [Treponema sp.]